MTVARLLVPRWDVQVRVGTFYGVWDWMQTRGMADRVQWGLWWDDRVSGGGVTL